MTSYDTAKGPSFSAYVLLSEPLRFNTNEIETAVLADYPVLDIETMPGAGAFHSDCDTAGFITTPLFMLVKGADGSLATLTRLPGYGTWEAAQLAPRQSLYVPDIAERLARNASYICVSTSAASPDPEDAFRAARLCSCLAAVFAKKPAALAVYWETADHFLTPQAVVEMADQAVADTVPVEQWVGLHLARDAGKGLSQALTCGIDALAGCEISFVAAPVPLQQAGSTVLAVARMLLQMGHSFGDGDTLSQDGAEMSDSLRIRVLPQGTNGTHCTTYLLVHPQSPVDVDALAGPAMRKPSARGAEARSTGKVGFFKRLLQGMRAQ